MSSNFGLWLLATRPKTLVASIIPVSIGVCLAFLESNQLSGGLILLCFVFSILIQIATNFANDYFDSLTGADKQRELGPKRFAGSKLINGKDLRNMSYVLLFFAFCLGIFIMEYSGSSRLLLLTGICSVLCALAYTGGPFPFAYNGLGDLFVIIFFGFVAVCTTHYVLVTETGKIWKPNWIIPLGVGFIINNLLVVNNYRDKDTDQLVGKKTLVVFFGRRFGVILFTVGIIVPCLLCPLLDRRIQLVVIILPLGIFLIYKLIKSSEKKDYDFLLAASAVTVLVYGIVAGLSLIVKTGL